MTKRRKCWKRGIRIMRRILMMIILYYNNDANILIIILIIIMILVLHSKQITGWSIRGTASADCELSRDWARLRKSRIWTRTFSWAIWVLGMAECVAIPALVSRRLYQVALFVLNAAPRNNRRVPVVCVLTNLGFFQLTAEVALFPFR